MATPIATGQISIVDFNDAPSLTAYISTSASKSQIYDPATNVYAPNWSSTPPVLIPTLFISNYGNADQIGTAKSVTWFDSATMGTAIKTGGAFTIGTDNSLKISQNILTGSVFSKTYVCEIIWTDPITRADLTIRCDFTFTRANNGSTGAPSITAVLSNDTHTVPTDSAGNGGAFGGATTTMSVYFGATDDSTNWSYAAVAGSGVTGSLSGRTYTVTAMTSDNGYVDITASKSGNPSVTKRFSIVKNKQGIVGQNATSYWLSQSVSAIQMSLSKVYTPGTVTFSAFSQTGSASPAAYSTKFIIAESTDGSTYTDKYTSSSNESSKVYTPTPQATSAIKTIRVRLYPAGVTPSASNFIDEQIIAIVSDGATGAPAVTAVLSNDAHTIPTDSSGGNGSFGGANTTMAVYVGATDDSSNWTITASAGSGVTGSLSGKTYTVTAMSGDNGYVDLTAAKSGYTSVTKRFTLSKNKQGVAATSTWLVTSSNVITKNISNVYSPTSVTFSGKSQLGSDPVANYSGRFIISETTDGTNFTDKYTSSANEASKSYTPSAGIKGIRVRLYAAGGTTNQLDEQFVTVVSDGATGAAGADSVMLSIWAPDGNVFRNGLISTLSAQIDVYKGAVVQTSGVTYEWFIQDPDQTTDTGVGAGWAKLTSTNQANYGITGAVNTNKLTIPADAVINIAVFKIKITFGGRTYTDSIVFNDTTDPIMVDVASTNGDKFKNGDVNTVLTCILRQNTIEIDPLKAPEDTTPYKYTYTWTKYDVNGIEDTKFGGTGTKTGKQITVTPTDVVQKATFNVEVT